MNIYEIEMLPKADEAVISTLKGIETVSQQMARQHSPEYDNQTRQINELESQLLIEKKKSEYFATQLRNEAEQHLESNKNHIDEISKIKDKAIVDIERAEKNLEIAHQYNNELIVKVNSLETKFQHVTNQFQQLKINYDTAINKIEELEQSENILKIKNQDLYKLLTKSLEKSLTGINQIISNNSQLLYIVFGVKRNLSDDSQQEFQLKKLPDDTIDHDMFSGMELDEDQKDIIKMSAEIGAKQRHKNFIKRFIKEVEKSIIENQKIAKELQDEIKKSLSQSHTIKQDIEKLNEMARDQLSELKITVQTQQGIVLVLNQIIDGLQSEINDLKVNLAEKNNSILNLKQQNEQLKISSKAEKEVMLQKHEKALEFQRQRLEVAFNEQLNKMLEEFNKKSKEKDEVINTMKQQTERVRQEFVQTANTPTTNEKVEAELTTTRQTSNDAQLGAYADKAGWAYFWYILGDCTIAAIPNFLIGLATGFGLWGDFKSLFSQRAWKQHEETEQCKEREEKIPPKTNQGVVTLESETSQTTITKRLPKSSSNKSASLLNENDSGSNDGKELGDDQQTDQGNKQSVVSAMQKQGSPVITNVEPESEVPDLALSPKPTNGAALNYV